MPSDLGVMQYQLLLEKPNRREVSLFFLFKFVTFVSQLRLILNLSVPNEASTRMKRGLSFFNGITKVVSQPFFTTRLHSKLRVIGIIFKLRKC